MHVYNFRRQVVAGVKMSLFLELIIVLLVMFMIKKHILVLGEGPTQGQNNTMITAVAKYPVNVTESQKKICVKSAL